MACELPSYSMRVRKQRSLEKSVFALTASTIIAVAELGKRMWVIIERLILTIGKVDGSAGVNVELLIASNPFIVWLEIL